MVIFNSYVKLLEGKSLEMMLPLEIGISEPASVKLPEENLSHICSVLFPNHEPPPKFAGFRFINNKTPEIIEPPYRFTDPTRNLLLSSLGKIHLAGRRRMASNTLCTPRRGCWRMGAIPLSPATRLARCRELRQSFVAVFWKTQGWFKTKDMLKLAMECYGSILGFVIHHKPLKIRW